MRKINETGLNLIKQWEGLRLDAYQDVAGVWTIGYGHTRTVTPGMRITEQRAEELLTEFDLPEFEKAVSEAVTVELTDNQFAALVSFTYNVGIGALQRSSLLKKLNAGDYDAVPFELAKWNKARVNGKLTPVRGLTNRRAAEAGLWAKEGFVSSRNVPVEPNNDRDNITESRTTRSASLSIGAMVMTAITALLTDPTSVISAVAQLDPTVQIILGSGVIISLLGTGLVLYYRRKDWNAGWR